MQEFIPCKNSVVTANIGIMGRFFSFLYNSGPEYPSIETQIKSGGSRLGVFPENVLDFLSKKNRERLSAPPPLV